MTGNNFSLEIESNPNNLITVEEFVNYFSKELNLDESKLSGLLLAVTEAVTNAIIHANKCDETKKVQMNVTKDGNKLIITIKDEGKG